MKKFLALALVFVMAFTVALTAVAADQELLDKTWVDVSGADVAVYPAVALEFDVIDVTASDYSCADYADPDNIPVVNVYKDSDSDVIYVGGIDDIEGVGLFKYTFVEVDPQVAGVTADTTEYTLSILRTYVEDAQNAGSYTTEIEFQYNVVSDTDANKVIEIVNVYEVSALSIDKAVTGNLSNKNDEFTVTVTFESELPVLTDVTMPNGDVVSFTDANGVYTATEEITISDNDGVMTINGIPAGVVVTVEETETGKYDLVKYTVDGTDAGKEAQTVTIGEDDVEIVVTNEYKTEIDTGVSLDSLPYILILIAVGGAAVFYVIRKRRSAFDAE